MRRIIQTAVLVCIFHFASATFDQTPPGPIANQVPPASAAAAPAAGTLRFLAIDKDGHPIRDLKSDELRLRLNKEELKILSLTPDPNAPKGIGLFSDTSGSKRRDKLTTKEIHSIEKFLESIWHANDIGFVISFNHFHYTEAKPTSDRSQIEAGLQKILSGSNRGSTALMTLFALFTPPDRKPEAARNDFW